MLLNVLWIFNLLFYLMCFGQKELTGKNMLESLRLTYSEIDNYKILKVQSTGYERVVCAKQNWLVSKMLDYSQHESEG